jgi:hypothetical protein
MEVINARLDLLETAFYVVKGGRITGLCFQRYVETLADSLNAGRSFNIKSCLQQIQAHIQGNEQYSGVRFASGSGRYELPEVDTGSTTPNHYIKQPRLTGYDGSESLSLYLLQEARICQILMQKFWCSFCIRIWQIRAS